jgi:membrane-associated phospholipid phosphatase
MAQTLLRWILFAPVAALAMQLRCAVAEDPVLRWNEATIAALRKDASAPLLVARTLAMLHLAQWRAAQSSPAGDELAIAAAGYTMATSMLPGHAGEFEELWKEEGGKAAGLDTAKSSIARGQEAARAILEERESDGSAMHLSYTPRNEPGQWRRTPPFHRPPELIAWAQKVRPFVIERPDQFRLGGPPKLESAAWAAAFNEIKSAGGQDSTTRSSEQAAIARFWADFSNTETPPGHWNSIAATLSRSRNLSLGQNAELFAVLNMTMVDAGIAIWDTKYHYNFWRPVTAIARAGEDGNDATAPEPAWLPLLPTPAHPEYPSGHSGFSMAAAVVLAHFMGTDAVDLSARSDSVPGAERKFTSLRACAEECGLSRIYAGIHYRFSYEDGKEIGRAVAEYVLQRQPGQPLR